MAHSHQGHSHSHHHHGAATGKILIASLVVTLVFVATEAVAGWWSGSLALLSDAGHNFTDAFGLVLAATAYKLESRPGDQIKTFGYQRTGVLAAFVNALMLVGFSVFLIWESIQRLRAPEPINDSVMMIVAGVGLVINLAIAWGIGGHGNDLNLRATFLHQLGDAASCVGIILGAIVIHYTGWVSVDPILSILMSIFIIWTAWDIFKDSLNILLEGLPKGLNLAEVTHEMRAIPRVFDVHDLHIWSLGSEASALSCHVVIEDMPTSESELLLASLNRVLSDRFHIHHATIQFEHTRCAAADDCAGGASREMASHVH
ncbi:MAG: cation diffusion facilitator family transporter [Bryobacteraceae bacterium]